MHDVEPSDWPLHLAQHSTACIAVPCLLSYVRSPIASPTRMCNDGMIGMLDGIYRFRPDPARRRRDRRVENGTVTAADVVAGDDMMWEEHPSKHPDVHESWPLTPKVCARDSVLLCWMGMSVTLVCLGVRRVPQVCLLPLFHFILWFSLSLSLFLSLYHTHTHTHTHT